MLRLPQRAAAAAAGRISAASPSPSPSSSALLSSLSRRAAIAVVGRQSARARAWSSTAAGSRVATPVASGVRERRPYSTQNLPPWQTSVLKSLGPTSRPHLIRNPSVATCVADALSREPGTRLTDTGALVAYSGAKTGRSPSDKRVVGEEKHRGNVWWGPVNIEMGQESFAQSRQRAVDWLGARDKLYVVDAFAGWDPRYRLKIRVICSRAYHALFMSNMLIRPTAEELASFGEPDFTIYNSGQFPANVMTKGVSSRTSVSLSFDRKEFVILGTEYAGEMKKGVFTVMHYLMPLNGILSLHTSANEGLKEKDVSLFFGLSGTGKTTLSADPQRALIGDDEHCWSNEGIFNIEGGCYAKAIDLSAEKEPEIFSAIKYGSILENVILDEHTGVVDYTSKKITENTRACYPIEFIPNAKMPCVGGHPKNIILLTCDAFGVLPPVSKLTPEQSMYHFISGYTAKIAGTEEGVTEPMATFSACFGQPFLVWHPIKYAEMLAAKLQEHKTNIWLVNTGWTGGKYGVGSRISLKYSRAIIDAIHDGSLDASIKSDPGKMPIFNLTIPKGGIRNVPDKILNPAAAWGSQGAFDAEVRKLAELFQRNFEQFKDGKGAAQLVKAGPVL